MQKKNVINFNLLCTLMYFFVKKELKKIDGIAKLCTCIQ